MILFASGCAYEIDDEAIGDDVVEQLDGEAEVDADSEVEPEPAPDGTRPLCPECIVITE